MRQAVDQTDKDQCEETGEDLEPTSRQRTAENDEVNSGENVAVDERESERAEQIEAGVDSRHRLLQKVELLGHFQDVFEVECCRVLLQRPESQKSEIGLQSVCDGDRRRDQVKGELVVEEARSETFVDLE